MNDFERSDYLLPYNPSDVDIRKQTFSIGDILRMISSEGIELWRSDDYQRKSGQWTPEQRSRLIESLFMRIPLPIFYFDGSEMPWKIIDGLHRLTTLFEFAEKESFRLVSLEYLKTLEGKRFSDLPFKYQRVIHESTIETYIVNPGTPEKVKLNIFQRINTGGKNLSRQEIRNSYYRGKPSEFINDLSSQKSFLLATQHRISSSDMKDREVALRFFSFYKYLEEYSPPMDKFLDMSMQRINDIDISELHFIKESFKNSMMACLEIFGDKAFYILNVQGEKQSSTINIALLEAWSVNIAQHYDNINTLVRYRKALLGNFVRLLQDVNFHKSISSSTSSKKAVYTRFKNIKDLIISLNANQTHLNSVQEI